MKEDVEYFWTNIFWKWLSYFILRRFLEDSVKFLSDLFPLLEKKKKRKRLKEFRRKRVLPPRKFKLNKKDVEKCSVYYKRLFIFRTFSPRKMRFRSRYILYCRGFLSREISMIVSSVDNGRTFTTTNESELIFIEATRFEPIVLHRISICFVGESRHGRAYTRAVLHRFGLDQPSRTKVWQLLSTWRVAIKIVTFLFSVNPVYRGQRGHLHIKLSDLRHARQKQKSKIPFSLIS